MWIDILPKLRSSIVRKKLKERIVKQELGKQLFQFLGKVTKLNHICVFSLSSNEISSNVWFND